MSAENGEIWLDGPSQKIPLRWFCGEMGMPAELITEPVVDAFVVPHLYDVHLNENEPSLAPEVEPDASTLVKQWFDADTGAESRFQEALQMRLMTGNFAFRETMGQITKFLGERFASKLAIDAELEFRAPGRHVKLTDTGFEVDGFPWHVVPSKVRTVLDINPGLEARYWAEDAALRADDPDWLHYKALCNRPFMSAFLNRTMVLALQSVQPPPETTYDEARNKGVFGAYAVLPRDNRLFGLSGLLREQDEKTVNSSYQMAVYSRPTDIDSKRAKEVFGHTLRLLHPGSLFILRAAEDGMAEMAAPPAEELIDLAQQTGFQHDPAKVQTILIGGKNGPVLGKSVVLVKA